MANRKRKNKMKKARELIEEKNIIDLETQRENRRRELRAEAEASRKKRGAKSIKDQIMEEISMGDMVSEGYGAGGSAYMTSASKTGKKNGKGKGKKQKKLASTQMKICMTVVIVVLIALILSIGNIVSLKMEENRAKEEIELLKAERAELSRQVSELGSDQYVEQQARNWLKMARQDEVVYVLEGGQESDAEAEDKVENSQKEGDDEEETVDQPTGPDGGDDADEQ